MVDPAVFIDCRDANLYHFRAGTEAPIIDQMEDYMRPKEDTVQRIPVGRIEHRQATVFGTIGLTIFGALVAVKTIIQKAREAPIRVW